MEAVNAEVNSGKGFAHIGEKGFFRVLAKVNKRGERRHGITLAKITLLLGFTLAAYNHVASDRSSLTSVPTTKSNALQRRGAQEDGAPGTTFCIHTRPRQARALHDRVFSFHRTARDLDQT